MKQETHLRANGPTRLQRDLLPRIIGLIRSDGLERGAHLREVALARRLQVSRTPVRAALEFLAKRGVLDWRPRRGFVLSQPGDSIAADGLPPAPAEIDQLCLKIAGDRMAGRLPIEVTQAELLRRYAMPRPLLLRVLDKLAEVALIERKPGHGWLFSPAIDDAQARMESYEFRRLIEPASVLAPSFKLDPLWISEMRHRHEAMLAAPWRETSSIELFEMNAAFHEGLVAAARNRFMLIAVQQQTRLRRFANYNWTYGYERVVASCTEHLEILDRLAHNDREVAAALLRRHLDNASKLRRPTEPY
ncbi:MAG: GntR family transcriptional regulator [Proteobacteria bacterium]|nr:GntR family transcriptional regulator [Pseudomonadota bacterium]